MKKLFKYGRVMLLVLFIQPVWAETETAKKLDDIGGFDIPWWSSGEADAKNQVVGAVGGDYFLVVIEGRNKLWNAVNNTLSDTSLPYLPAASTNIGLADGFINWVQDKKSDSSGLIWWHTNKDIYSNLLVFDFDEYDYRNKFLYLDDSHFLACGKFAVENGGITPQIKIFQLDISNKQQIVLQRVDNAFTEENTYQQIKLLQSLKKAGVVGDIPSVASIAEKDTDAPLLLNIQDCSWRLKNPPQGLQPENLSEVARIDPHWLEDGSLVIGASYKPKGSDDTLGLNPLLLWNKKTKQWQEIAKSKGGVADGARLYGITGKTIVACDSWCDTRLQFLDVETKSWLAPELPLSQRDNFNFQLEALLSDGSAIVRSNDRNIFRLKPDKKEISFVELNQQKKFSNAYDQKQEVRLPDGSAYLIGDDSIKVVGDEPWQTMPLLPGQIYQNGERSLAADNNGNILLYGKKHSYKSAVCSAILAAGSCTDTWLFDQQEGWVPLPELAIAYDRPDVGDWLDRDDVIFTTSGDLVYLDAYDEDEAEKNGQQHFYSYRWRKKTGVESVAATLSPHAQETLLELDDGRLVIVGGRAKPLLMLPQQQEVDRKCDDCPMPLKALGEFTATRLTEVFDIDNGNWHLGPLSHYAGGTAWKLANGRIVKLACREIADDLKRCELERADLLFSHWQKLPAMPQQISYVEDVFVFQNKVLVLVSFDAEKLSRHLGGGLHIQGEERKYLTLLWDDDTEKWHSFPEWTDRLFEDNKYVASITPLPPKYERARIRYRYHFEMVSMPVLQ